MPNAAYLIQPTGLELKPGSLDWSSATKAAVAEASGTLELAEVMIITERLPLWLENIIVTSSASTHKTIIVEYWENYGNHALPSYSSPTSCSELDFSEFDYLPDDEISLLSAGRFQFGLLMTM